MYLINNATAESLTTRPMIPTGTTNVCVMNSEG